MILTGRGPVPQLSVRPRSTKGQLWDRLPLFRGLRSSHVVNTVQSAVLDQGSCFKLLDAEGCFWNQSHFLTPRQRRGL